MYIWLWIAAVVAFGLALGWEDYRNYRRFLEGE